MRTSRKKAVFPAVTKGRSVSENQVSVRVTRFVGMLAADSLHLYSRSRVTANDYHVE